MQECLQPGATVSSVAIRHGINANVIRKWLPVYRDQAVTTLPAFVPVQPLPKRTVDEVVVIVLPLGSKSITVKWPALHIPAHRDRPFRLNVTACSGLS